MPDQSTPAPTKRQRLAEILTRLGKDATTAAIREEAWKVGFGAVNNWMMVSVRNEVWPTRAKRRTGLRSDGLPKRKPLPVIVEGAIPCPRCGCKWTRRKGNRHRKGGSSAVLYSCQKCQRHFLDNTVANSGTERRAWIESHRAAALALTEKECTHCKRVLSVACFGKRLGTPYYNSHCKECRNGKRRVHALKIVREKHSISTEEYNALLKMQDGRCAICRSTDTGRKQNRIFSFDHDHATGKPRGLLCNKCNTGIGLFGDNPDTLESAARYLREHGRR